MPSENPLPVSVTPDDLQIVSLPFEAEGNISNATDRLLFYADRETVIDHIYVMCSSAGTGGAVKVAVDEDPAVVDANSTFLVGTDSAGDTLTTGANALSIDADPKNNVLTTGQFLNIEFVKTSGTLTINGVQLRIRTKRR